MKTPDVSAILRLPWAAGIRTVALSIGLFFLASPGWGGETARMVKDIAPGTDEEGPLGPQHITGVGDWMYFLGHTVDLGTELWRSDGTREGTELVRDINPGWEGSVPRYLTVAGDTLFFSASDGASGTELWACRDTTAWLVKDIVPGLQASNPYPITALGDSVVFFAYDGFYTRRLWVSDGTGAGTSVIAEIDSCSAASGCSPERMVTIGDVTYFRR